MYGELNGDNQKQIAAQCFIFVSDKFFSIQVTVLC